MTLSRPVPTTPRAAVVRLIRDPVRLLLAAVTLLTPVLAMAIEEAPFEVLRQYPAFELRRYGPGLVAEITVDADFAKVGNKAFMTLADFIGGKNQERAKIAMTAPVLQAPTTDGGAADRYVFAFVMPSTFTAASLPRPADPRIRVRAVEPRLLAARRYSGTWSKSHYLAEEATLLDAVRGAGLTTIGAPIFARYNPPFLPWFLRRNEVLIEVSDPAATATPPAAHSQ